MILNPDCIRDLMLFFEEHTYVMNSDERTGRFHAVSPILFSKIPPLDKYTLDEIVYHCIQLSESKYIITDFSFENYCHASMFSLSAIYYVTPKGHEFIASIKLQNTWNSVKSVLKPLGSISLAALESVSAGITDAFLNRQMGLGQ